MRLPKEYMNKENTQVFLANGVAMGEEENQISFSVVGKVVKADDKMTEVVTEHGRLVIQTETVIGAYVGNLEGAPLIPEALPKNKATAVVREAVRT